MLQWAYRNLIIPGFESLIKRRRTFHHLRDLEVSQWWTLEQIQAMQRRRLRALLTHCQQHSPWYRDRWKAMGLQIDDVTSLESLSKLPVTTRAMMRDHADQIRSTQPNVSSVTKSTGGSSGVPLCFQIESDAIDRRVAATFRGYGWAGAGPGTRQTHLWGVQLGSVSRLRRWKTRLHLRGLYRSDYLNSFDLSDSTVSPLVRRINQYRPDVLVAYTNPLYRLSRMIADSEFVVHRPKSIIVGAEKLYDFQRQQMERVFNAPVFETYGSREFTLIGAECDRHDGLHLTSENLIVEITDEDGSPTPDGEEGQILITDLFNTAMPFVRYAIGDRAIAGFRQCECGRGLPLLRQVVGRELDILSLPNGQKLPGEFFPHLIKDFSSIQQFQVVQTRADHIEIQLVVDSTWNNGHRDSLRSQIMQQIGSSTRLSFKLVDVIPLTSAGKRRVVIGCDAPSSQVETRVAG